MRKSWNRFFSLVKVKYNYRVVIGSFYLTFVSAFSPAKDMRMIESVNTKIILFFKIP